MNLVLGVLLGALIGTSCSHRPPVSDGTQVTESPAAVAEPAVSLTEATREPVLPSLTQLSEEIGLSVAELQLQTRTLSDYLDGKSLQGRCVVAKESEISLCRIVDWVRVRESEADEGEASVEEVRESKSRRRVVIRPALFRAQQGLGYGRLNRSMNKETPEQLLAWTPELLKIDTCPRNLSAVVTRRLEALLPDAEVRDAIEALYAHAEECLRPIDSPYVLHHFRQALLRYQWGNLNGARDAMQKALLSKDERERSRLLYWAGRLAETDQEREALWGELVRKYPLSFHALEIWRESKTDPLVDLRARGVEIPTRDFSGETSGLAREALTWVEAMAHAGRSRAQGVLLDHLVDSLGDQLSSGNLLYLAWLRGGASSPHNTIRFLARQMVRDPGHINEATLRMLFPKPFYESFDRSSPGTDTYLLLSVARQESAFNKGARSPANAQGLLQLLPGTARLLTGKRKNNLYDPELNIELGTRFLSSLIDRFNSVELALAAYNAGPNRIPGWQKRYATDDKLLFLDLIPFQETRNYVSNILRNNYWYRRLYVPEGQLLADRGQQQSAVVDQMIEAHLSKQ